RSTCSCDSPVQYETSCDDSLGKLEHLPDFRVPNDAFSNLGIKHSDHRFFDLIDQFIDDAVKLDLNSFPLRRGCGLIFDFDIEADDDGVRSRSQQYIGL